MKWLKPRSFAAGLLAGLLAFGAHHASAQTAAAPAATGKTELLWLGQAGFRIKTPGTLAEFQEAMKGSSVKVVPMTEGQSVEF